MRTFGRHIWSWRTSGTQMARDAEDLDRSREID
jgi:hypothetical protein